MYGNSSPKKIQRRLFPGKNTFDLDIGKIHGFLIVQIDANESFDRPFEFLPLSSFPFERLHFKTIQKIHACIRITRIVLANNASLIVTLHCDRMFASHKRKRAGHGITSNPRSLRTTLLEYDNSVGWPCLKRVVELWMRKLKTLSRRRRGCFACLDQRTSEQFCPQF